MTSLEAKHPGESEYLQAVKEVLLSIEDIYNQHPEFEKASLIERLVEPDRIFTFKVPWVDDKGKVTANAVGTTKITAKAGNVFAECTITVRDVTTEEMLVDENFNLALHKNVEVSSLYTKEGSQTTDILTNGVLTDNISYDYMISLKIIFHSSFKEFQIAFKHRSIFERLRFRIIWTSSSRN